MEDSECNQNTFYVECQWGSGQKNQKWLAAKNGEKETADRLAHYHLLDA